MEELSELRRLIDGTDRRMAALFEERMALSRRVAQYKKERGIPVKDEERERELLSHCGERLRDKALTEYYRQLLRAVIDISCDYQEEVLKK